MDGSRKAPFLVFSDLDGTLLDLKDYSFDEAKRGLSLLEREGVPLVLVSSKTRAEIELWRERFSNLHPFISENGGGIFVPKDCSPWMVEGWEEEGKYRSQKLGIDYPVLRRAVDDLRSRGLRVRGFGDMGAEEVAELTGLNLFEANLAKMREFSEPCLIYGDEGRFLAEVSALGLTTVKGGRFFHLQGHHDKGEAVELLIRAYGEKERPKIVALGDSLNDLPMLRRADIPVLIRRKGGPERKTLDLPNLIVTEGEGPSGWAEAIEKIFG
ncbi:MAG: mannosyl-3-phosphoglycerate phosphatase [Deltaproteobacteria bacterium]|nr:MAG: mannosyl-3-phosphoglycerate phosphatase [Deltaproteobacteria bacterium]